MSTSSSRLGRGLVFAILSAISFSLAGTFASGLMGSGWSPGAAVTTRATVGGLALLPLVLGSLRGRWHVLRTAWKTIVAYGVVAVACCQLFYFFAVQLLPVGVALLMEYLSPLGVLVWLWLAHHQRPGRLTLLGTVVALAGLVTVIDLFNGLAFPPLGIMWALLAMVGAVFYFVISADESHGLPPIALAGGGLLVGAVGLWLFGLTGLLPLRFATADVDLGGHAVPWWVAVGLLGLICAAVSYSTGIEAARCLGSRLASFLALVEVIFAFGFAWLLIGQVPTAWQVVGAVLILAGVVLVKLGEPDPVMDVPLDEDGVPII